MPFSKEIATHHENKVTHTVTSFRQKLVRLLRSSSEIIVLTGPVQIVLVLFQCHLVELIPFH